MKNSPLAFFEHEKFGSLRVVRSDQGAQWFVAKVAYRTVADGAAAQRLFDRHQRRRAVRLPLGRRLELKRKKKKCGQTCRQVPPGGSRL